MADENKKTDFKTIGNALGANGDQLDALKKLYGIAADQLGSYLEKYTSQLSKLAGPAGTVVSVVAGLITLFGEDSGPDSFDRLFDRISGLIQQLDGKIDATSRQTNLLALAGLAQKADAAQKIAKSYAAVLQDKTKDPSKTVEFGAFSNAISDTTEALQGLYNEIYWTRTFDKSMVYEVPGSLPKTFEPPRSALGSEYVWDYRAALPTMIKVIQARIACMMLGTYGITQDNLDELNEAADYLTIVHNRIQAGFRLTQVPGVKDTMGHLHGDDWQHCAMAVGFWDELGRPCGAVDIFAGTAAIESFPLAQPRPVNYSSNGFEQVKPEYQKGIGRSEFNLLFLTRALRARAALDEQADLPGLRAFIARLREMTAGVKTKEPKELPPSNGLPESVPDGEPKALRFGPREIASPSLSVLFQLARPLAEGDKPPVLAFETGWPSQVSALTSHFADQYKTGKPQSVGSMVCGD